MFLSHNRRCTTGICVRFTYIFVCFYIITFCYWTNDAFIPFTLILADNYCSPMHKIQNIRTVFLWNRNKLLLHKQKQINDSSKPYSCCQHHAKYWADIADKLMQQNGTCRCHYLSRWCPDQNLYLLWKLYTSVYFSRAYNMTLKRNNKLVLFK